MKLNPETRAAHRARHHYPPHTLAPDPRQGELDLRPRITRYIADVCPRCGCLHTSEFEAARCRQEAREQR